VSLAERGPRAVGGCRAGYESEDRARGASGVHDFNLGLEFGVQGATLSGIRSILPTSVT
jgi:hypothetical protein